MDDTYGKTVFIRSPQIRQYGMLHVRQGNMCIDRQLKLKGGIQRRSNMDNTTHIEDLKNPNQVHLPGGDRLFVALRVDQPGEHTPLTFLSDLFLHFCQSPATMSGVS
jgi:hypothetical protein